MCRNKVRLNSLSLSLPFRRMSVCVGPFSHWVGAATRLFAQPLSSSAKGLLYIHIDVCIYNTQRARRRRRKVLKSIPLFLYQMCSFPVLFLLLLICLVLDCVCIRFFFDFNLVNSAGEKKKKKTFKKCQTASACRAWSFAQPLNI